ncbi:DUF192 domain-containing protein [Limimaricola sp.]|uniref:DUF192 domain-containing protein n=1 Tax=Limimaricola sp. TaxID=2211665 RepID=UPI0025BD12D2|nr:DUF192 domain-containing protein [Limimaricola sp.]
MTRHLAAALAAVLFFCGGAVRADTCSPDRATVQGAFGRAAFHVSVADTPALRRQGLMNVSQMPTMSGMIFLFDPPTHAVFWMHDTLIPLDMLFIDSTGRILRIAANARPMDDTPIDGGEGVRAVVEINGGMSARLGIAPGDLVQHPAFGADAALPCDG